MSKLDEMTIAEILTQTNLCLSESTLQDIWNADIKPEKSILNPEGTSAIEQLKDSELVDELITNVSGRKLARFLFAHEKEINKVKLVLNILRTYKDNIQKEDLSLEEQESFREGMEGCKRLLKDINETFVYYVRESETARLEAITIVNTREEAGGKPRERKPKNVERLQILEAEEDFSKIIEFLTPRDVEHVISYSTLIGTELRFVIEHNTALDVLEGNLEEFARICKNPGFNRFVARLDNSKFNAEMAKVIRTYIEEIDIDKMLMCSAVRIIEHLETNDVTRDDVAKMHRRLKAIQRYVKRNSALEFNSPHRKKNTKFDTSDLEIEMKKFITNGEALKYYTTTKCRMLKLEIIAGNISLNSLNESEFNALLFDRSAIDELLQAFPNNYIFFLRENAIPHSKEVILNNIINSNQCSQELLKTLCEKLSMTSEEICELYEAGIISVSDLQSVRAQVGEIISDTKLFEKYIKHRDCKEAEKEATRVQLERYALAYKKTELNEKTDEELEERGEIFVENVGEDINPIDLIYLYGLDIIPLKVAVDWGGEHIIEKLLQSERLKPADARYLRDKGLLDENILARLFKNSINMSYAYQVALVCTVFDGQTQEEQDIKQRLAQYYHIENGISKSNERKTGRKRINNKPEPKEPKARIKMRDPGAKYNLLSAIDKGVKIEEGIIDGHIIFHYPNVENGLVLIEKLHKITTNKDSGLIEIRADNESATYIISEEEFIQIKSKLIQDGKIDRTQLTERWFRKPGHWIAHAGKSAWEKGIKERFEIDSRNPRYTSKEDLDKMEELLLKSSQSKDLGDR